MIAVNKIAQNTAIFLFFIVAPTKLVLFSSLLLKHREPMYKMMKRLHIGPTLYYIDFSIDPQLVVSYLSSFLFEQCFSMYSIKLF